MLLSTAYPATQQASSSSSSSHQNVGYPPSMPQPPIQRFNENVIYKETEAQQKAKAKLEEATNKAKQAAAGSLSAAKNAMESGKQSVSLAKNTLDGVKTQSTSQIQNITSKVG